MTSQLCFHFSNFEQNCIKGLCSAVILRFAARGCRTPFAIPLTGDKLRSCGMQGGGRCNIFNRKLS